MAPAIGEGHRGILLVLRSIACIFALASSARGLSVVVNFSAWTDSPSFCDDLSCFWFHFVEGEGVLEIVCCPKGIQGRILDSWDPLRGDGLATSLPRFTRYIMASKGVWSDGHWPRASRRLLFIIAGGTAWVDTGLRGTRRSSGSTASLFTSERAAHLPFRAVEGSN